MALGSCNPNHCRRVVRFSFSLEYKDLVTGTGCNAPLGLAQELSLKAKVKVNNSPLCFKPLYPIKAVHSGCCLLSFTAKEKSHILVETMGSSAQPQQVGVWQNQALQIRHHQLRSQCHGSTRLGTISNHGPTHLQNQLSPETAHDI